MISEIFTDEPIELGNVRINGAETPIIIDRIPLGIICRIVDCISSQWINTDGNKADLNTIFNLCSSVLNTAPHLIAILLSSRAIKANQKVSDAISKQWTPLMLLSALRKVYQRISLEGLFERYQFVNNSKQLNYPGEGTPWATVINSAIASKGWSEDDIKWNISFVNLIMYTLCIPSYSSSDSVSNDNEVDMFDFFDKRE